MKKAKKYVYPILFSVGFAVSWMALVLIPIPHVVFLCVVAYRAYVYSFVSMAFPDIPVYQELFGAMIVLLSKAPFVYTLFGGACWLLGIPGKRERKNDGAEGE